MINLRKKNSYTFCLLLALVLLSSCTSNSDFIKGKQQLESQGYTNIKNTGFKPFYCGEDDVFSTGFTALDSKGNKVDGCFCGGLMKGVTIRY